MKKIIQFTLLTFAVPIVAATILTVVVSFFTNVFKEGKAFCKCQTQYVQEERND